MVRNLKIGRRLVTVVAAAGLLGLGISGCTPGALTSEMGTTPDIPDQEACDPTNLASVMSPLVMEWPTAARGDVESAMQDGVVVLAYNCEGVKVLQDCRVPGDYRYRAVTPKSDDTLIEGSDNIRASFGGGPWSFGGGVDRSAKLDLSYMLVGKRSTLRSSVHQGELEGEDFCKGATHFVKRVDMGAWTMVAGKDVKAGLAVKIMNQGVESGSQSKEMRSKADGDPKSCKGATRDDADAPTGCGALIRVTLAPIKAGKGAAKGENIANKGAEDEAGCPSGFAFSDAGVCVKDASNAKAVLCKEGDEAGCKKQCNAGSDKSCNRFANHILYANMDGKLEDMMKLVPELKPMTARFETACAADEPGACMLLAMGMVLEMQAAGDEAPDAAKMGKLRDWMSHACVGGDPKGCGLFRTLFVNEKKNAELLDMDGPDAYRSLLKRGCNGGSAVPCGQLAFERATGGVLSKDAGKALKLASDACLGDHAQACLLKAALESDKAGCEATLEKFDRNTRHVYAPLSNICSDENLDAVGDDAADAKRNVARACALGLDEAC